MSQLGLYATALPGSSSLQGPPSLDEFVDYLISETTDTTSLVAQLKASSIKDTRDSFLTAKLSNGKDPLSVLDPERHTIGYLYILCARLHQNSQVPPSTEAIEEFCRRFNPQHARLLPEKVTTLAKGIVGLARKLENPKLALRPLHGLVTRYPISPAHLTTLHPIFLTLCVATQHFTAALPVLETPITTIDMSLSDLTYNDNLVYHYAGGVALGALKRWREAEEFLEICASSPAQVPAAVQMEASKKLVLIQLILYGKTVPPPKYTNPVLQRLLKSSPYGAFIKSYPQQRSQLLKLIEKDIETFTNEKNLGLVRQTIDRAPRWLIRKLTATYLTMGLADIAKEVGIETDDEVRAIILNMIDSGDINASISADGTVTFADQLPQISKADVDRLLKQAQEQSRMLLEMERSMNSNKDYLNKVSHSSLISVDVNTVMR
ncbi:predicted protein [Postia placenta Mad-698-R]|uniref:COP9 signalosome complex subunit 3 n=1 Tax=Postia placenta MAD-698-R-SB12 TaxID=670580 RepID=A0A1X6N442_9APHY|nr:hypothetical protein POSPLADRAFT_1045724 [Postia placenta MAD-698-R-SB12]EED80649.1 predicted protein [Postia placenta Mad-698-R]OSX63387.1 hypothetical protein POSPLADRAFT_1045724 [Postia placenta MAD-698-R-SB12]